MTETYIVTRPTRSPFEITAYQEHRLKYEIHGSGALIIMKYNHRTGNYRTEHVFGPRSWNDLEIIVE